MENLVAAQRSLRAALERSQAVAVALDMAGSRLQETSRRLPSLEAALRPVRARKEALLAVGGHIDRAVGPAAAVLRVFDAVHGLEPLLLSDPRDDLSGYLSVLRRLEEALFFLAGNCNLAIQWLEDMVDHLEENSLADGGFLAILRGSLLSLKNSSSPLDGGLLGAALRRLESEFRRLLAENSVPLAMAPPSLAHHHLLPTSLVPAAVSQKLVLILERLAANGRLENCIKIYTAERVSVLRASLSALDLDYLEKTAITELDDVRSIEDSIARWREHLEFAVKHLFESEYKLCSDLLGACAPPEQWMGCFAEIASQAGIIGFLRFGMRVTESKKDPIKLLKLLDIFSTLDKLRVDFNRLFGGKPCGEIKNLTRDLIRRVVDGACDIFWELLAQVELQGQMPPPPRGSVPKLVTFITGYCNTLLGEEYRPVLTQVLKINHLWRREQFQEGLLAEAILNVVKALEENLDEWSRGYEDPAQASLFLMNAHWHFHKHLLETDLGELLGEDWLKGHRHYSDYYMELYLRQSWGRLPGLLSREGLALLANGGGGGGSGGGRSSGKALVKKRLRAFDEAFDEIYRRHSRWVIQEKDLREELCNLIVQKLVPRFRTFMKSCGPLVEQEEGLHNYSKYTVQSLESMLGSLFQDSPGRSSSFKHRPSNGKVNDVVSAARFHHPAPAVV